MGIIEESSKNVGNPNIWLTNGESGRKRKYEATSIFPPEIITEILSWLPMKHLLQVQLVSKEWQAIIHDRCFMEKHTARNAVFWHYHHSSVPQTTNSNSRRRDSQCSVIDSCDGLLLLRTTVLRKYLIWNPFIRRLLRIPDPHDDHDDSFEPALIFVPSTANYRLVSIYTDKDGNNGCQVITPGPSMSWRCLPFPHMNTNGLFSSKVAATAGGVVHCIRFTKVAIADIVTLDVATECFTVNYFPNSLFHNVEKVSPLDWDAKLAMTEIVGLNLHVVVLEDYKKPRWSEKKIIPLAFVKDYVDAIPLLMKQGDIWFLAEYKKLITYTIKTGKLVVSEESQRYLFSHKNRPSKPSLVAIRGMQPDTKLENIRPYLRLD